MEKENLFLCITFNINNMAYGEYTHKMQRIDKTGYNVIDIEDEFQGLIYLNAKGMNDVGKAKNIYTETYADSDDLRVYVPESDTVFENGREVDSYTNEATVITMSFAVVGDAYMRQLVIDRFESYLRHGVHLYKDNARNREFRFVVQDEIKVSDEKWHGNTPYIILEVPMQNLNGKTRLLQYSETF